MTFRTLKLALALGVTLPLLWGEAEAVSNLGSNCHRVYSATSEDGFAFSKTDRIALNESSAPDAVLGDDGQTILYFVNGDYDGHGMWRAEHIAKQVFKPAAQILLNGQYNQDAVTPDVVRLPDGRWRLYYFESFITRPSRLEGSLMRPIYTALSDDGVNFTIERKIFDVRRGSDPTAVRLDDGTFILALAQIQDKKILIGTSEDGATFTLNGRLDGGIPELMKLDDGSVRLLYYNGKGFASYISKDKGESWDAEPGLRLEVRGEDIGDPTAVRKADGTWEMYYRTPIPNCVTNHVNYLKGGTAGGNAVVNPRHIFDGFSWEGFATMPQDFEDCMAAQISPDGIAELKKGKEPWEKKLRQKAQVVYKFCQRKLKK